ncbi:MAG: NAD(P)H-hydrate dehydratase [Acidobacteriota bacterium]
MRLLRSAEMREVDRRAIEDLGIPSMVLMENAAIGVADAIAECFPQAETVTIFCGPGNNGGDGLALARHLEARGYRLCLFLVTRGGPPRGDAGVQLEILQRAGEKVQELTPEDELSGAVRACSACDLIVDALFGTGLSRPLEGHFVELLQVMGEARAPILAVDLPSGLDASRGSVPGPTVRAEVTVTFAAPKVAHCLPPAAEAVGRVVVTDLGIPSFLIDEAPGELHLLTAGELSACLLARPSVSHKGDYGHVLLIGGSPGKAGAMVLAARAAVRGGAGLVTAAVPAPILPTVDGGSVESMTLALPAAHDGELAVEAAAALLTAAEGKRSVAIGPGMGVAAATQRCVRQLCAELTAPLVLDADGLNAFASRLGELAQREGETVLTPHPGEMGRLLGITTAEVQDDRIAAVRRAAETAGAIVVLKGSCTLIAEPGGDIYVNVTGNPGMATGGSGDVLTGLLAALLAQGYEPLTATQLAVFLHGLAGDLVVESAAPEALVAGDLIAALSEAFERLRQGGER